MILSYSLLGMMALFLIWQDIQNQTISLWCLCLLAVAAGLKQFYEPNVEGLWVAGIIFTLFLACQGFFTYFYKKLAIGWADLFLGPICGTWLYVHELPYFLISVGLFGFIMGIIWRFRWRYNAFPFAPAILGGQGIVLLSRCFLAINGL